MTPDVPLRRQQLKGGPRRPDLPDVGADLRLQPGVRPLPVVVGPARPPRADHRRGQGGARRAAATCRSSTSTSAAASRWSAATSSSSSTTRVDHGIGVKFSTNGAFIDAETARRLAAMDYLDIQISLDGADAATNDAVRGVGSYDTARRAMDHLADAGFGAVQDQRRRHPPQRRPARRVQGAGRLATAPSCASPACARPAAAPTRGTTCTRPTPSSARSTTGCWPRATTCSPATRSSTSTRSASRCPA